MKVEAIGIHNKKLLITLKISNSTDLLLTSSFYCVILHKSLQNLRAILIAFSSSARVHDSQDRCLAKHPFTRRVVVAQLREYGRITLNFSLSSAPLRLITSLRTIPCTWLSHHLELSCGRDRVTGRDALQNTGHVPLSLGLPRRRVWLRPHIIGISIFFPSSRLWPAPCIPLAITVQEICQDKECSH